VNERIGTIHTVQEREANAVIFILGAPEPRQARSADLGEPEPAQCRGHPRQGAAIRDRQSDLVERGGLLPSARRAREPEPEPQEMSLPSYVHFIGPLLEYLGGQSEPIRPRVVYAAVADRMDLSIEARAELLPSGKQAAFHNRIGWAHDALKRAGLSSAPTHGAWLLTEAGRKYLADSAGRISREEMERIGSVARDVTIKDLASSERLIAAGSLAPAPPADTRTPTDQINDAVQQIRTSVKRDLVERFGTFTPTEFEQLVLQVLHKLGYGTSIKDLRRVGGSGDGGIDGIISLDKLGLQKVYVQAKRWQGQVGSPQIQTFMGALRLQGADKGVLIAAGSISEPARQAAKQAHGALVLIDGEELADLMIDHQVGVTHEPLFVPKIDIDFFEGE
jgi:restriction system protein